MPSVSSKITKEYSQLTLEKNHAPPNAMKIRPNAKVLKELRSYFRGFEALIPANATVQHPYNASTNDGINDQSIKPSGA